MKNFNNKVVAITGAGSGIGRALAIEFGQLGAKLALNDWNKASLEETVKLLQEQGVQEIFAKDFDVSDEEAVFTFAADVQKRFGNAHVIINNAGTAGSAAPAYGTSTSIYKRVMEINYMGVVYGTKAFLPQFVEQQEGAVVNISSVFGLFGAPNNSDYSASKFAVRGFTEALSVEFHKSPIGIHCVHPGGIDTNIIHSAMTDAPTGEFDGDFLTTPPRDLARRIIRGIIKNEPRIIYGNQSFQAWIGSLLPKRLQNKLVWKRLTANLNLDAYREFIRDL